MWLCVYKKCGRKVGSTSIAGFNVSSGCPASSVDIKLGVPTGCPLGTTYDSVSTGYPVSKGPSSTDAIQSPDNIMKEAEFHDDNYDVCIVLLIL